MLTFSSCIESLLILHFAVDCGFTPGEAKTGRMGVLGVKIAVLALIAAIKMGSGLTPMFLFPRMRKKDVKKRVIDKVSQN